MTYDNQLSIVLHIKLCHSKAKRTCKLIHRVLRCRSVKIRWQSFAAYVRPVLEYASVIWSRQTACDRQAIESVQNRFLKSTSAHCGIKFLGCPEKLRKLEISTFERRRLVATLTFVYSVFSGHVVCYPREFFSLSSSTLPSRSRPMYRILPVRRRSQRLNKYFSSKIVSLWDSPPKVIVRAKNASKFKRKVRQWLS